MALIIALPHIDAFRLRLRNSSQFYNDLLIVLQLRDKLWYFNGSKIDGLREA